ncbi:hypothetical protein H072_6526 [Dactylellina haptotyla CBS 200.50]|uniref:Fungal N-terminal domain-containing protein n=1 Tax=Dactylellina haptotyla (strain CBS 200.50) TaxID=1284197 RepID=S8BWI2_DACHA|nr:hypothetical protein H072_6526 [Dactylellina haptotyla CBS 200.50]
MDPLSITAGVFSILGSLAALALKINEVQGTIQEARPEIQHLTEEVDSLKLILKQIDQLHSQGGIARDLMEDLTNVLQRLNSTVVETDCFLRGAMKKSFRAAAWTFSGKAKSIQFCRRIESYKSTLNMTLVISTISSGRQLHGRADQILTGINDIRTQLPGNDDYILQRFLTELETVYEGSTVIGAMDSEPEPVSPIQEEYPATNHIPDWPPERVHSNNQANPGPVHESGSASAPSHKIDNKLDSFGKTKLISKNWRSRAKNPKWIIDLTINARIIGGLVATYGNCFAVFIPEPEWESHCHGKLVWGDIDGSRVRNMVVEWHGEYSCISKEKGKSFPHSKTTDHLKFQDDNTLIGVFGWFRDGEEIRFVVCWNLNPGGLQLTQAWISPIFDVGYWKVSALSASGKLFSYFNYNYHNKEAESEKAQLFIVAVDKRWQKILSKKTELGGYVCRDIVFSQNEDKILIFYTELDIHEEEGTESYPRFIEVCEIKTGKSLAIVALDELFVEPKIGLKDYPLRFFFTGTNDNILIVGGYYVSKYKGSEPLEPKREDDSEPVMVSPSPHVTTQPDLLARRNFCATLNTANSKLTFHKIGPEDEQIYREPVFAPDGSCFIVTRDAAQVLSLSSFPGSGRSLYNYAVVINSSTGEKILRFETKNKSFRGRWYGMPCTFDATGERILILDQVGKIKDNEVGKCRLDVWEAI